MIKITNVPIFISVLKAAKLLKSEYIVLPRTLTQTGPLTSIMGISYNAIVTSGYFETFKNDPSYYELWDDRSLSYISFMTKDINPFFNMHKATHSTTLSDGTIQTKDIEELYIDVNEYIVGNVKVSIGYRLVEPVKDFGVDKDSNLIGPSIELFPYDDKINKIQEMLFSDINSISIIPPTDLTHQEDFMDIINSKAGVGATIWVPKMANLTREQSKMYSMSLTGTLLYVSKGDSVYGEIKDRIPNRPGYNYMVKFTVSKPKKKCVLEYRMMMLKVG